MKFLATIADTVHEIEVRSTEAGPEILLDGQVVDAEMQRVGSSALFSLLYGGESYELVIEPDDSGYAVTLQNRTYRVRVEDERTQLLRRLVTDRSAAAGPVVLRAPMPGLVVRIEVSEGQKVRAGDGVVVVEAMKMENEIRAPISGVVKKVAVRERQAVEKDETLVTLEADGTT